MPEYQFKCEGCLWSSDKAVVELPSVREAQIEAVEHLAEMLRGRAEALWEHPDVRITVSDGSGLILFSIELAAILAPTTRPLAHSSAR